jgi:mRNA-degrading endonuclease YafQ of YafQ-DinJ toxin-antitoxin module
LNYTLVYPESYIRRARKFLKKHPELRNQYRKTLQLLELDPFHPSLRLHSLQGRLQGLSSVFINISYRIVIQFVIEGNEILLVNVGKHEDVY